MGGIRLLLALSVVLSHSSAIFGSSLVGGRIAVESFFMISGFYMALVLTNKYRSKDLKLFYQNRYLRLYPSYALVLIATLLLLPLVPNAYLGSSFEVPVASALSMVQEQGSFWTLIPLLLANVTLLFHDVLLFCSFDGVLSFATDSMTHPFPGYWLQIVPQAWTLSLELMFYLIAPFLVRTRLKNLLLVMLGSLTIRFLCYYNGLTHDPWRYRFFPNELIFFCTGILAYHLYHKVPRLFSSKRVNLTMTSALYLAIFSYSYLPGSPAIKQIAFLATTAITLPFIFSVSQKWSFDRWIGELSYPVYICHVLLISILAQIGWATHPLFGWMALGTSLLVAILLAEWLEKPLNRFRQARVAVRL
jgi:peptidoglycan/LPS O-acetylase OafA/YrhL